MACTMQIHGYAAFWNGNYPVSTFMMTDPQPHAFFKIARAGDILPAVQRFGLALKLLFPEASFRISPAAKKQPGERLVPGFDAEMNSRAVMDECLQHVTWRTRPVQGRYAWLHPSQVPLTGTDGAPDFQVLGVAVAIQLNLERELGGLRDRYPNLMAGLEQRAA